MSKFLPIESYSEKKEYKLLPFNFERLSDDRYFITNLVGEYLVVNSSDINNLINKSIDVTTPLFSDLRAKHFVRYAGEQSALQLLGLKVRTKHSRLADFTSLHIFVVTLRCDHSCPYCQVSRRSEDTSAFDMTREMADKSLDIVFRSPSPTIKIEFQGGEPLLNFDLIKYIVVEANKRNLISKRHLGFVIATTLSMLSDEHLEFCKDNNISLSSSLDGPESLHNSNRPRPGKDSHQRFVSGLNAARNILGHDQVSALMTTTDKSLPKVRDIIDEYLRLGFGEIFLRHLSPYGFAIKTKKYLAYNTDKWLDFYKEGLDYIIEINKAGVNFVEQATATIVAKMLTSNDPMYVDMMSCRGGYCCYCL
ncbi:His-Xaa-Ser system radical SAM maturase HxsB [Methylobacillus glycogenes]|uniref:His-Xaa-Ser system radical SAM maturase HxsB n=1 Tax=Methylobacillus glycogenes TaxID=406 RepID=UPI000A4CE362|nr:His-Xaa-Ser system radical SAM maturase HxsB [Methylobacillus glycogenes]